MRTNLASRPAALVCLCGLLSMPALAAPTEQSVPLSELSVPHAFAAAAPGSDRVVVRGVTAYSARDLLSYAAAHEHSVDGASSLADLIDSIEQVYREDGYLLAEAAAGVDPATGVLVLVVHEGHIERIETSGLTAASARAVEQRFAPLVGQTPLHTADFERALMLASDLAGVDLRSEFVFAPDGEGATLRLHGAQLRQAGSFSVDNVPLPGDDSPRAFVIQEFYSVATGGDLVRLLAVATHEFDNDYSLAGTAFYRRPVGHNGTYVEAYVGNAFARRDYTGLTGTSDEVGLNAVLAAGHALRRDLHGYTYVIGEYEYSDAESRLGTGDVDSVAHAGRAYLVHGVSQSDGGQRLASLTLSAGGRPDRKPTQPFDGDRRFTHLRASLGWIQPLVALDDQTFLRAELTGQWTGDSLPQVEKFAIGHWPYLRGYAPAEAVGDRGYVGTLELSHVFDSPNRLYRSIAPFAFFDFGGVEDEQPVVGMPDDMTLASTGLGAVATLGRTVSISAWAALALDDGRGTESGDVGFYLSLTKGWGR